MLARASQRCHTHTQTRQTKWSCECSVAWNHGCFSGQRRLSRVSLPPETPQIFRSFSPSTHWTGQSPCQQDERNASVTAKSKCLPVVCRSLLPHSRCPKPSTGITSWKWASTCRCSCASLWTSSGKWVLPWRLQKSKNLTATFVSFKWLLILCLGFESLVRWSKAKTGLLQP